MLEWLSCLGSLKNQGKMDYKLGKVCIVLKLYRKSKIMESMESEKSNIVYISNFPKKTMKSELEKMLSDFGPILSLNIIHKSQFCFAFAEFDDIRDAALAVKELNQKLFKSMNLKVQFRNKNPKAKESIQLQEQKQKMGQKPGTPPMGGKASNSPHLETNCSLPQSQQKPDNRLCVHQGNTQKMNRKSGDNSYSSHSISPSPSPSPSRSRNKRVNEYRRAQDRKYEGHRQHPADRRALSEIYQIRDMMDYLAKMMHKLEDRMDDFMEERGYSNGMIRKRN